MANSLPVRDFSKVVDKLARGHQPQPRWYGRLSVTLEGPGVFEWARLHLESAGHGYRGQFGRLAVVQYQVTQIMNNYGQQAQIEFMYPGPGIGGDDPVPSTIMGVLAVTGALLDLPDFHLLSNCHMNIMAQTEAVG